MDQKSCLIKSELLEMGEEDISWPMLPADPQVPSPGSDLPPACVASTRGQRARCEPQHPCVGTGQGASRSRGGHSFWGSIAAALHAPLTRLCSDWPGTRLP